MVHQLKGIPMPDRPKQVSLTFVHWIAAMKAERPTGRLAAIRQIWNEVQDFIGCNEPPVKSLMVDEIRIGSAGQLEVDVCGELDLSSAERDLAEELELRESIATLLEEPSISRQKSGSTVKANPA
jgi:hypothetical protein